MKHLQQERPTRGFWFFNCTEKYFPGCTFQFVVALYPVDNNKKQTCGHGGLLLIQLEEGRGIQFLQG